MATLMCSGSSNTLHTVELAGALNNQTLSGKSNTMASKLEVSNPCLSLYNVGTKNYSRYSRYNHSCSSETNWNTV